MRIGPWIRTSRADWSHRYSVPVEPAELEGVHIELFDRGAIERGEQQTPTGCCKRWCNPTSPTIKATLGIVDRGAAQGATADAFAMVLDSMPIKRLWLLGWKAVRVRPLPIALRQSSYYHWVSRRVSGEASGECRIST